jgi:hypothetical protein
MNELERFEEWAKTARGETVPRPDVAASVVRRLEEERAFPGLTQSWWGLAGASACAAALCAVWGLDAWNSLFGDCYAWIQDFSHWSIL